MNQERERRGIQKTVDPKWEITTSYCRISTSTEAQGATCPDQGGRMAAGKKKDNRKIMESDWNIGKTVGYAKDNGEVRFLRTNLNDSEHILL